MNTRTEKQIEHAIIATIRAVGGWATKVQSGTMFKSHWRKQTKNFATYRITLAESGTPDILACINSRFVAIEVKATPEKIVQWKRSHEGTGQASRTATAQLIQAQMIEECGGVFIIASSVEDVLNILYQKGLVSKDKLVSIA